MPDARRLPMLVLAVATAMVAVVAVGMLAPSTSPEGADPLAAAGEAGGAPNGSPGQRGGADPGSPGVRGGASSAPGATPPGSAAPGAPAGRPATPPIGPDGRPIFPDPPVRITPQQRPPSRPGGPSGDGPGGSAPGEGAEDAGPPDGFRDDASAERADWLEDRMNEFVDTLIPEAAGTNLSRSCADNGRTCTFEGPATDDFAARWVRALSYGDMGEETLQGTSLRDFSFYETDDGLRFSITAKHPDAR